MRFILPNKGTIGVSSFAFPLPYIFHRLIECFGTDGDERKVDGGEGTSILVAFRSVSLIHALLLLHCLAD